MDKLTKAINLIRSAYSHGKYPVVAWSGGKDSMVLLHLIRCLGYNPEVFLMREPWQPSKYDFQNRVISDWNLVCHYWNPAVSEFQQNGDEFEIQNDYYIRDEFLTCPTGITKPQDGFRFECAIDMLKRPKQECIDANWDTIFIGHKGCDSDPIIGGDAGTRIDVRRTPGLSLYFPLKDWTHDDVWDYIEKNNVPWDSDRYEKVDGKYSEKEDRTKNVDYVHACTACIDRRTAGQNVYCPKFGGIVQNVSHLVPWYNKQLPNYIKD